MAREMFGDVVDPSIKVGSQQWYTVPLSIIVHTAIIALLLFLSSLASHFFPLLEPLRDWSVFQIFRIERAKRVMVVGLVVVLDRDF